MKKGNKIIKSLEFIAIFILIISFITLAYCVYVSIKTEKDYSTAYNAEKTATANEIEYDNQDISNIIENVNNSVVGISKIKNKGSTIFFEDGAADLGLGTGFIVSQDGYIVTNYHVSGEKNSICYVTLEDGRNYKANVAWADKDMDLSVIKINANNLSYLNLGDSDNIKIAQSVYAIGNPIGYEFQRTVTSGIISGLDRTIKLEEEDKTYYMEDLIQTDATINPGNSGGPLIDKYGNVIGVNSIKITSAEGIGFAIPINIVKPIVEKLKNNGEFNAATLGIFAYDKNVVPYINQESGTSMTLKNGIYVAEVIKNSPAEKYGIRKGDILIEIDGVKLDKMSRLRTHIYEKEIGDEVNIKYVRNNKEYELIVKLEKKI